MPHEPEHHGNEHPHTDYTLLNKRLVQDLPAQANDNTLTGSLLSAFLGMTRYQDGQGRIMYRDVAEPAAFTREMQEVAGFHVASVLYGMDRQGYDLIRLALNPNGESMLDGVRDGLIRNLSDSALENFVQSARSIGFSEIMGLVSQSARGYVNAVQADALEKEFKGKEAKDMVEAILALRAQYQLDVTEVALRTQIKDYGKDRLAQVYLELLGEARQKFRRGQEPVVGHPGPHPDH